MSPPKSRAGVAILLATLMIVSAVPMAGATPPAQQDGPSIDTEDDDIGPADEIYVRDNGSAVLVYNDTEAEEYEDSSWDSASADTGADTPTNAEYGTDISSNLFYLLVTEPVEAETDVQGQASVVLTESNITGDGTMSFAQPDSLSSLSFELSGESTSENAHSSMRLDATLDSEEASGTGLFQSASTSGTVTVTPDTYTTDGEFDVAFESTSSTPMSDAAAASFVLTEDDGSYTLDVERNTTISTYAVEEWSTREQARTTLEQQYVDSASQFGGEATVTIEEYTFTRESRENARLDIAYTVEYTDIESGLTEALAADIGENPEVDMDEQRAEELTTQMENLTVNRIAASYAVDDTSATADFEADIENYDDVVLAGIEIAQAAETENLDATGLENLDDIRTQIEAQQAADLEQRTTWSAEISDASTGAVTVDAQVNATTTNWDDYVTELNSRGVETYDTTYELTATTTDDERVNATGTLRVDGDLFAEVSNQLMNATEEGSEDERLLTAFFQADLERSRLNVSADDEDVRVEMAAQFNNLSALRDALAENGTVPPGLTSVAGRTDNGTTITYVSVESAVGANATESDVRELSYVDDKTTVHMPGDWDRSFPSVDTERAASFLGVDLSANTVNTASTASGGSGPGFGASVTVVALVAATLLARRRE